MSEALASELELPETAPAVRRKIAVLGGGCGSMAAVWALTRLPQWERKFDITVYQMGWRLGGKGASGRDAAQSQRILEHGLHVWAGFYDNAFRVMQEAYGELDPDPDNPIRDWTDAFRKLGNVILEEEVDGEWISWYLDLPENDAIPGHGGEIPSVWNYAQLVIDFLRRWLERHGLEAGATPLTSHTVATLRSSTAETVPLQAMTPGAAADSPHLPQLHHRFHPHDIITAAEHLAKSLHDDPRFHAAESHHSLIHMLEEALRALEKRTEQDIEKDDVLRRAFIVLDLGISTIKGILFDGVIYHGFEAVNRYEWREWLKRHGASEMTLQSAFVRGIYDYVFGYMKGQAEVTSLEAGTATNGVFRLFFTFRGGVFWEMQAGMGDIVFAPLYTVLARKGVKFEFFNRVETISVTGDEVGSIAMRRQAEPVGGVYEPLIKVKGVPAWPSEPDWNQLVDGERLRESGVDFESSWSPPTGRVVTLDRGRDFDDVILGISIGALRDICGELAENNERFASMLDEVGTVQTAATQLWLDPDAAALGAPVPHRAVTGYAQELNTWSDMSFLIPREDWPEGETPGFLAYFCGEFPDAEVIPPYDDRGFPARELARYRDMAKAWLETNVGHIWSKAVVEGTQGLDWALLHDSAGGDGEERLDRQFFRVNIDPTERYVASFPNTSKFRLKPDESGFVNLWLAGDWVRTSINAGCVEAAVMGGLAAAAALSGEPIEIVGGLK